MGLGCSDIILIIIPEASRGKGLVLVLDTQMEFFSAMYLYWAVCLFQSTDNICD
jgi:hypothetical protein